MKSSSGVRATFAVALALTDAMMASLAFYLAYLIRRSIPWPDQAQNMGPFVGYSSLVLMHILSVLGVFAFSGLYRVPRTGSRIDEFYSVFKSTMVGTLVGVALTALLFKNSSLEADYSRAMVLYGWGLTVVLVTVGRVVNAYVRFRLRSRGWGCDRLLIVGTTEVGRMVYQKIQSNPGLGYKVTGFVTTDGSSGEVPVGAEILGHASELAPLIDQYQVDEVIIALPEATHQDILMLLSECERGQVTIKVFPDVFQIMASPVGIGDLGGLPLSLIHI